MKNLLIYIGQKKEFDTESSILVKFQIDNSFELGWAPEDIVLVTNFDYEYRGVKALVIGDDNFCVSCPPASKINSIITMINTGVIGDHLWWFHDLDAFQLEQFSEESLGLEDFDMGVTDYGRMTKWSTGCIFFKKSSLDIMVKIKELTDRKSGDGRYSEEFALVELTTRYEDIARRVKRMNTSYNFIGFNIRTCLGIAEFPIKVVHFHPFRGRSRYGIVSMFDFFMGDNKAMYRVLNDRIIKLFGKYNVKYHERTPGLYEPG